MKFTSVVFLLFLAQIVLGQATNQDFIIGKTDSLYSNILKEGRRVIIHVPYENPNAPKVNYPVLYLLDGHQHFIKTIGILDQLSNTIGNELCPKMIVVAIIHNDRWKDLAPPFSTDQTSDFIADNFPEFLEKELIPFIDSKYPTDPFRVFVGHSLGGLRVVHTLVYNPNLFNAYLALDPSLGHIDPHAGYAGKWIERTNEIMNSRKFDNKSLFIAMGQTIPNSMDTSSILKDTTGASRHMRSIMSFSKTIEKNKNPGLQFDWKYYPKESHGSVPFLGSYDGLISIFSWYKNESAYNIFNKETSVDSSVKIITTHFELVSQKMGYRVLPPELSDLIDYLTYKKMYDKALAFAELNLKNYPNNNQVKTQYNSAKWNSKKNLSGLLTTKSAKDIYKLGKKEALKKDPDYNISEDAINTLGYELLQKNKLQDALLVFKLNIELYPNSSNVYDSYGECLLLLNKVEEGIAAYKKSLELDPGNSNASKIIKKYREKKN